MRSLIFPILLFSSVYLHWSLYIADTIGIDTLWIANKAEVDVFLRLLFFDDPMDIGSLISGSFAFPKSSLNIWKFLVHLLLKPGLENSKH